METELKRKRGRPRGAAKKRTQAERARDAARKRKLIKSATAKVRLDLPLSEAEACAYWNVARLTLARKRQQGAIRFFKIGDRILYGPSNLREDLEQRARPKAA